MIYKLTEKDLDRVDTKAVKDMIATLNSRLNNPYLTRQMIKEIKEEIKGLEELLEKVSNGSIWRTYHI